MHRLSKGVIILHKGLAVSGVLVKFNQLDVAHRVGLLDVRAKVEVVELK